MTISGRRFKPRLWSTALAAAVITIMLMLGNWQLSRAQQKEARQEQLDQLSKQPSIKLPTSPVRFEDFQYRRVELHGVYIPQYSIYLDNKIYKGVAGYQIVTPLRLGASSMHVLVNRGWVATGLDRSKLPQVAIPAGEVVVTGVVVSPTQKALELSAETVSGQVWENLQLERYRKETGLTLQPLLVLQQDNLDDGLVRQWDRPDSGAGKNWGYALQWFMMALAVLIIYLVLSVKQEHRDSK